MPCTGYASFGADDIQEYQSYLEKSATEISDACICSRIAWNAGFNYQKTIIGGLYCLISDGGVFTTPHLVMPIGSLDRTSVQQAVDVIYPHFLKLGWPMRVLYIDEQHLPVFRSLDGYSTQIRNNPCFSDYVYDRESLVSLAGKALHAKRNHVNRFFRDYPEAEYSTLTVADRDDCLSLVSSWCAERNLDCSNLRESDYRAIRALFDHFDILPVRGGVIRIGGSVVAFAMGSTCRSTGLIHFEKAKTELVGLYAAINKMVVEREFLDCMEINREEDMGIEGLRKAKLSYIPSRMIHKYEAVLTRI